MPPEDAPLLSLLMSAYHPDCELETIDSDALGEGVTFWWSQEKWAEFSAQVDSALSVMEPMDDDSAGSYLRMQIALPAGNSWPGWLRYLRAHLAEFYPHRKPQTISSDGVQLPRASRFDDKDLANIAATEVLRANETLLRTWAAEHDGTWRLHLYADLGRRVGDYLLADDVTAYHAAGNDPALRPASHEATGCVVVMRRNPTTGTPYIATTHPEKTLPIEPRHRYPDLPLLFGGYLGQDYTALDANRWVAERNLNQSTAAATLERIADQLSQLLTEDDDTLRTSVDALGSYVMPRALRRWVTGLHRRMTRLDWEGQG